MGHGGYAWRSFIIAVTVPILHIESGYMLAIGKSAPLKWTLVMIHYALLLSLCYFLFYPTNNPSYLTPAAPSLRGLIIHHHSAAAR